MRVFEQRRRTDGQRPVHHFEQRLQVGLHLLRQLGLQKGLQNLLVGRVRQGFGIQSVALHELVEDISAKHHSARNGYLHPGREIARRTVFDEGVDEGQTAPFAAHGALSYARKVGIAVKAVALVDGHHTPVFHAPVSHNGVEDELTHRRCLVHGGEIALLYGVGNGKEGARVEPAAHGVGGTEPEEGFGGYVEDVFLQLGKIADTHYLHLRGRVVDNEIAEAEIAAQSIAQILRHCLALFVNEHGT